MDFIAKMAGVILLLSVGASYLLQDKVLPQTDIAATISRAPDQGETVTSYNPPHHIENPLPGRAVRIASGQGGHFFLDAHVNGTKTPFLVDTGASIIALSYEAARNAGIRVRASDFTASANTANGVAKMAIITLDEVQYKNIRYSKVRAGVLERGALAGHNLLGNSFLSRLKEFRMSQGELVMIP